MSDQTNAQLACFTCKRPLGAVLVGAADYVTAQTRFADMMTLGLKQALQELRIERTRLNDQVRAWRILALLGWFTSIVLVAMLAVRA